MSVDEIKNLILGEWVSIAPEIRPSSAKNADGTLKPFYLTRQFKYLEGDKFELAVTNLADPYGKVPLARIFISGHMQWKGNHPIADGAQKVDFVADDTYTVTPLLPVFADAMNQLTKGFDKWEAGKEQSIFKKAFPPLD